MICRHVGTSVYDDKSGFLAEDGVEVEEGDDVNGEMEEEEVKKTIAELGDTFAMQLGLGGVANGDDGGEEVENGSECSSSLTHSQQDTGLH